nr:hypothetical protein [Tanacetum cinerariifolium]
MNNLEKQINNEILHEKDSKSALSVIKVQFDKVIHSDVLKPFDPYSSFALYDQEVRKNFKEYTQMEAQTFKETIIKNMNFIEQCIVERANHEQELHNGLKRLNKRKLQIQECKVQEVKASDASSGDKDCSRIVSDKGNIKTEFERYKAFNDRTIDYDKLERLVKEKTKVIMDLKLKEENDIDKMISMEKQLKFLNQIVYERNQSIQTIHMLAPKGPTFNGRPTFSNLMYLKMAQSKKPCLYEILNDQFDPTNRLVPDREETPTLEREGRLKLNKDLVRPYDYTKLHNLYEIFKPVSQEYHEQLAHANKKMKGMSVDTNFEKQSILGKPPLQPIRNQPVIPTGQKFSPNKSSDVYLKTTPPRSGLIWKPTGRIFTQVGLKWIPIRKPVESRYNMNDSASPLEKETHNPNTTIYANSSSLSAGTSMASEPISSKGSSNESENLIKKPINWDEPPKNRDGAWHAKIRLVDPDGEEFTKTLQSIPTTRKLFERESPREIIDLDHFYDT